MLGLAGAKQALNDQRKWIAEKGGTLAGYIDRYGSADDPDCYGNGGEAIWRADLGQLSRLKHVVTTLTAQATDPAYPDINGNFLLADGSRGNPGCDECGMEDAVIRLAGRYLCVDPDDKYRRANEPS